MKILNLLASTAAVGVLSTSIAACGDDTATGGAGSTTTSATTTQAGTTASSTHSASSTSTGSSGECADLCTTYGPAVPTAAGQIVDAAATDPEFQPFFQPLVDEGPAAVTAFKTSLGNFIAVAYGCAAPATYTGPDMMTAHTGLNITSQQYDDFVTLIAGVLHDDGVPDPYITSCFAPALTDPAFKATIVGQ